MKEYNTNNPHPITKQVGENIRKIRRIHGVSQEKLAEHLGIAYQQLQKNENGTNRMPEFRLWMVSKYFDVPLDLLFDGVEGEPTIPDMTGAQLRKIKFDDLTEQQFNFIKNHLKEK